MPTPHANLATLDEKTGDGRREGLQLRPALEIGKGAVLDRLPSSLTNNVAELLTAEVTDPVRFAQAPRALLVLLALLDLFTRQIPVPHTILRIRHPERIDDGATSQCDGSPLEQITPTAAKFTEGDANVQIAAHGPFSPQNKIVSFSEARVIAVYANRRQSESSVL